MSDIELSQKEKPNNPNHNKQLSLVRNNLLTLAAAFAGVTLGVLATFGYMSSYLHSQLANQTAAITHQIVSLRPADLTSAVSGLSSNGGAGVCGLPAATTTAVAGNIVASAGELTSTITPTPPTVPTPPTPPTGPSTTFISKLVSGILGPEQLSISNTGTNSNNTIKANNEVTTTVTNTNDFNISSSNTQTSTSGSATTSQNTSGGSSTSGSSTNSNATSMSINVNN